MVRLDNDLNGMSRAGLEKEIIRLRTAIRYARDQMFDEKCWLDFFRLFELLPERQRADQRMLSKEQMRKNCDTFIDCMQLYIKNPDNTIDELYNIWKDKCPYKAKPNDG